MGSSKKSKDKDRKKKKRDRSRSRSRDRDRHRRHHKHKKHKRAREELSPSISLSDISDIEDEVLLRKNTEKYVSESVSSPPRKIQRTETPPPRIQNSDSPSPLLSSGGGKGAKEVSLSVEESNKIRAKLGLKPLQVSTAVSEDYQNKMENKSETLTASDPNEYKAGVEVHKPPENLLEKLQVEKLREKIALQREKRRLAAKFSKTATLAGSDEDDDNALAWIMKSRQAEKERKEAEKRNKMLEELDAQFGIGDLVEEEMSHQKKHLYGTKNLSGLKVQHDLERFQEGYTTILTLKDSNVLDAAEDTLVNVNIADTERAEKNIKLRKMKPDYDPEYDASEVDKYGNIVMQNNLLNKYDEEIFGEKRSSFRIGNQGFGAVSDEPGPDHQNKVGKLMMSLNMQENQLATEYLTPSEMVSFKKVKKKRKKKLLTADDLEPVYDVEAHLGSRNARRRVVDNDVDVAEEGEVDVQRVKTLRELMEEEEEPFQNEVQEEVMIPEESDEGEIDAIELQEALARSRRAKLNSQQKKHAPESITDTVNSLSEKKRNKISNMAEVSMTLNLTDEFCRSLGDIPTYGLSGNRAEEDAVQLPSSPPKNASNWDTTGAWEEVDIEDTKVEISNDKSAPILEEEPDTGRGVVNALRVAVKKGYLEKGQKYKPVNATLQHLRAVHYSIEDKTVTEDDRRGGGGRNERYMGPVMDFKEKDSYRPDVKLEYVDDDGRKLNAKEAFRYLSHKFHGKGSGKNKMEKRMKKWQEELLMKHMSSSDTPLQTLERQREKQKQLGAAFLVLSGNKPQESMDVKK